MTRLSAVDINLEFRNAAHFEFRNQFSANGFKLSQSVEHLYELGKPVDSVSKRTVENFFGQVTNSVNLSTVDSISYALFGKSYSEWVREYEEQTMSPRVSSIVESGEIASVVKDLDASVLSLLENHYLKNLKRYNSVKILTMDEPLELDKIYVDVNLLRRKSKREILLDSVDRHSDFESFDDVISSTFAVEEAGVDSFHALQRFQNLMVWGGLGTGKTTFLKTIATQKDSSLGRHPVFIELRSLVERGETIFDYVHQELSSNELETSSIVNNLLEKGGLMILLDGLDEVSKSDFKPLCKQIEDLVRRYPFNQFVLSCRYGIYDYGFTNFTEVEVARLSDQKIEDFISKWFEHHEDQERGAKIIQLLNKNKILKDFASTPLMLNMLCLNIKAGYGIPENAYSVYDKAVKAAVERWDQNRFIDRDSTKLTTSQRLSFLSDLAFDGLSHDRKKYTWSMDVLKSMVRTFIEDSSHYDSTTIDEDCDLEIKAIEGYHSLLERTADNVYKFSTPAYQHYFAADYAESSRNRELLKEIVDRHVLDKQWREIFIMIAEKLKDASELVVMLFEKSNEIANELELQSLLSWVDKFTQQCNVSSSSWRAGVLTIDMELDLRFSRYSIPSETRTIAHQIASSSRELNRRNRSIIKPSSEYIIRLSLASALALAEDQTAEKSLSLSQGPSEFAKVYLGDDLLNVYSAVEAAMHHKHVLDDDIADALEKIYGSIPKQGDDQKIWRSWAKSLQNFMVSHLEVGQNIELSSHAADQLTQYLYVQEIVIECLLVSARVKSGIRDMIRQNLVKPRISIPEICAQCMEMLDDKSSQLHDCSSENLVHQHH